MAQQNSSAFLPSNDDQRAKLMLGVKSRGYSLPAVEVQANYVTLEPQFLDQ
jgi:hypothetical protein